jgi:D-glycero-D-manno-heptose 1,7-bisphosphate phosphatase
MLIILDLDDTLITSGFDRGVWVEGHEYSEFELLPGVKDRLRYICERKEITRFAICTNQAGVAFGYQTEAEVRAKMAKVLAELEFFWSRPFSIHICHNHPEATVDLYKYDDVRRKPNPGMLEEAIRWHQYADALPMGAVYIGDMETDKQAAEAAGIPYLDHEVFTQSPACGHCGGAIFRAGGTYVCNQCGRTGVS